MRRRLALLPLCLLLLLCGCGGAQEGRDLPQLILRYADNQPEDYPTTAAAEYFAQLVEERTRGRIRIRLYCNGELGNENQVLEQVRFGGIDMARVSVGTFAEPYPKMEVLLLPFLYDDAAHMWRVLDGPIGDEFLISARQTGVVGLSWFDAGARSFYTREPIGSLEDLRGLTIRVQESAFMSRMVELLGAKPVQIPYNDVYSALRTGKIDGAENNWPSYAFTGHYQAARYCLQDEHSRLPEMQIMSTVALDKIAAIDPDYVAIIRQCAQECALYERELWQAQEAESERLVREHGCLVTQLTGGQREAFRRAVEPMYQEYPPEEQALIRRIRES